MSSGQTKFEKDMLTMVTCPNCGKKYYAPDGHKCSK